MNDSRLKLIFGFVVLAALWVLALVVAVGHVEERTSFGLPEIIGGLLTLAGGFVNYAFGRKGEE